MELLTKRRLRVRYWQLPFLLLIAGILINLACSAGNLLVQAPTPTATRLKTPKPTFTLTPVRTATFTPSPTLTNTPSPTPTETPTPLPTETPSEEAAVDQAPPAAQEPPPPPPPAEPTATPIPEEPTATPAPDYPFTVTYYTHDTGSPGETRITAWIRRDSAPGIFKTLDGYQVKVFAPDGQEYLSELSGPGTADSTVPGTGDNHRMNTKLEIVPYTAGDYRFYLVEGGAQVSSEVTVSLSGNPLQYLHIDFASADTNQ